METKVKLINCQKYDVQEILKILKQNNDLFVKNIKPGDRVAIKPNWIAPTHKYKKDEWLTVITNPTLITAVLILVLDCLKGKGKIVIADSPQTNSSWFEIMKLMKVEEWVLMGKKSGIDVQILDLREDEWFEKDGIIVDRKKLTGDPKGSTECDLKKFSEFVSHKPSKKGYYGADYNAEETNQAHSNGHHLYRVSRSVIEADVFINIPKMKTHKKAGITCSLKNLVGINTYKNFLPHYSVGTPDQSGDQFPIPSFKNKIESFLAGKFKKLLLKYKRNKTELSSVLRVGKRVFGDTRFTLRSGNWHGNDTVWRMILDLNKILLYADPDGSMRSDLALNKKKYISIVDGIISGEGDGPTAPDQKYTGILIVGDNPLAVDATCAKLMGFDWRKIPFIKNGFRIKEYRLADFGYDDIFVESENPLFNKKLNEISKHDVFQFKPAKGWIGHIEANND